MTLQQWQEKLSLAYNLPCAIEEDCFLICSKDGLPLLRIGNIHRGNYQYDLFGISVSDEAFSKLSEVRRVNNANLS